MDGPYRVLICEDEDDTRELWKLLLCGSGDYECDLAKDGEEGRDLYDRAREEGRPYHLILTDVMMPRMNGFQLAHHVRYTSRDCHTRIVVVTGYPDFLTVPRSDYVHATEVWTKPVAPEEFKRRVAYLLSRRRTAESAA